MHDGDTYRAGTAAYGDDLALVHHEDFGDLARQAGVTLLAALDRAGVHGGLVVDLGCGIGILARHLTEAGFDVLGVDLSRPMLRLAAAHAPAATFVHASLLDFELPPCVAVTAIGECFNYAFDPRMDASALGGLLGRIAAALDRGGILLFDVAGPGRSGSGRSGSLALWDTPRWTVVRRAEEDGERPSLRRDITLFFRAGDTYRRTDERHVLHLHRPDAIATALREHGFTVRRLGGYAGFRFTAGWHGFLARNRQPA